MVTLLVKVIDLARSSVGDTRALLETITEFPFMDGTRASLKIIKKLSKKSTTLSPKKKITDPMRFNSCKTKQKIENFPKKKPPTHKPEGR
jgi:hypothetical protein